MPLGIKELQMCLPLPELEQLCSTPTFITITMKPLTSCLKSQLYQLWRNGSCVSNGSPAILRSGETLARVGTRQLLQVLQVKVMNTGKMGRYKHLFQSKLNLSAHWSHAAQGKSVRLLLAPVCSAAPLSSGPLSLRYHLIPAKVRGQAHLLFLLLRSLLQLFLCGL